MLSLIIIYFGVMFGTANWLGRKRTATRADFFSGRKRLGGLVTGLTWWATFISAGAMVAWVASGYKFGLTFYWGSVTVIFGALLSWWILAPKIIRFTNRRPSLVTVADFIADRFYSKHLAIIASIIFIIFMVPLIVSQFKAAGLLFENFVGIPFDSAIIAFGLVIIVYVFIGGYMAVAYTDVIQSILMLTGAAILLPLALYEVGGLPFAQHGVIDPVSVGVWPTITMLGLIPLFIFGAAGSPYYYIRFYSIKSMSAWRRALPWIVIFTVFIEFWSITVGSAGRVLYPGIADVDNAVFHLIEGLMPTALGYLYLTGVLAAMMSTMDSILIFCSSSVSYDMYERVVGKVSDRRSINIGRIVIVAVGLVSIYWGLSPPEMILFLFYPAWGLLGFVGGFLIYGGLFWKRFNREGAFSAAVGGALVFFIWHYWGLAAHTHALLTPIIATCLIVIPIFVIVTYLTPAPPKKVTSLYFEKE